MVKNLPANVEDVRDVGSISEGGRSPGVGNSNPLQYSCLENFMAGGALCAMVHGVAESDMTEQLTLLLSLCRCKDMREHSHCIFFPKPGSDE